MSWLIVLLMCWAAVSVLGAAWLGGAARVVAQEDVAPEDRWSSEPGAEQGLALASR